MFLTLTHSNFISILLVPSSCACTTAIFSQFCVRSRGQFLCCFFTPVCSFSFSVALHCCSCLSQYLLRSSPFSLLWFNGFAVCSFLTIRCYFRSFTSFSRFALFVFNFLYYSLLLFLLGFSYSFFFFLVIAAIVVLRLQSWSRSQAACGHPRGPWGGTANCDALCRRAKHLMWPPHMPLKHSL